jgi:hypothetical protein
MKSPLLRDEPKLEDEMIQNAWTGVPNRIPPRLKSIHLVRAGISVLLLAILAACGGNTAESPEAVREQPSGPAPESESTLPEVAVGGDVDFLATLNPCELLTPAELETFFGGPAEEGATPETIGPYRSCLLGNQSGGKSIILQVTHQTALQFKTDNEGSAAMLEVELIPVEGLGDEAVFYVGLLRVRTGDTVLQVGTWHPEAEQAAAFAMTQEIARLAIGRLP